MDDPTRPAEYDQRHRDAVDGMVDVVGEVVEAGVADLDLEPALARLLHHVAQLIRQVAGNAASSRNSVLGPERDRRGEKRSEIKPRAYGRATSKTLKSG